MNAFSAAAGAVFARFGVDAVYTLTAAGEAGMTLNAADWDGRLNV